MTKSETTRSAILSIALVFLLSPLAIAQSAPEAEPAAGAQPAVGEPLAEKGPLAQIRALDLAIESLGQELTAQSEAAAEQSATFEERLARVELELVAANEASVQELDARADQIERLEAQLAELRRGRRVEPESWSGCSWHSIGKPECFESNEESWCPPGSFVTQIVLQKGASGLQGRSWPIIQKVRCCRIGVVEGLPEPSE